jgi:hypothetical protein
MQGADDERIGQIIQLATDALDPDGLATGPADAAGMSPSMPPTVPWASSSRTWGASPAAAGIWSGPGYATPSSAYATWPSRLCGTGPPSQWPSEAVQALTEAARAEPAGKTRQAMTETLARAGHQISTLRSNPNQ